MLDGSVAMSIALLVMCALMIVILMWILALVHRQTGHINELKNELRLHEKAKENKEVK